MKVRVKSDMPDGFYGFYGDRRRMPGQEFELIERESSDGKIKLSTESQFSEKWMEQVDPPKKRGRQKADPTLSSTDID